MQQLQLLNLSPAAVDHLQELQHMKEPTPPGAIAPAPQPDQLQELQHMKAILKK